MRISSGSFEFSARNSTSGLRSPAIVQLATCPIAWTPASVRPLAVTLTRSRNTWPNALTISLWIDGELTCVCQPP